MQKFKNIIPRSLYGRFLLIVIGSALIVQIVSIYVFYYSHLDVISKHMARSVVTEMNFVKNSIDKPDYKKILDDLSKNTGLKFSLEEQKKIKIKKIADSNWKKHKIYSYINPVIDPYNRFKIELKAAKLVPYEIYKNKENDDFISVKIQSKKGILSFDVPVKKITSSSSYVFIFWMTFIILLTSTISLIFFKNQIKWLRELSKLAEEFGRGQNLKKPLKPQGSKEIRSLTISFIKMKERVTRQINQRTEMLSAVSHDLRTPLTRMKLQIEMMKNSEETEELKKDIDDMEKIIKEYLDFANLEDKEKSEPVDIREFLENEIIKYYSKMNREIKNLLNIDKNLIVLIRKTTFKRAIKNLIDNAFIYGKNVELSAKISNQNLIITIDDDGPGIPEAERKNVFKPFYRIDNARNLDKETSSGGSGLGLSIVFDAITSHGGQIKLLTSPTIGGLRIEIKIPI